MDKYYTPELEEFHIGFEYEWLNENNEWIKETSPIEITIKDFNKQTYGLRVKYLDKEDIKSLGWELKTDLYIKNNLTLQVHKNSITIQYYDNFNNKWRTPVEQINIKNKSELVKLLKQLGIG